MNAMFEAKAGFSAKRTIHTTYTIYIQRSDSLTFLTLFSSGSQLFIGLTMLSPAVSKVNTYQLCLWRKPIKNRKNNKY